MGLQIGDRVFSRDGRPGLVVGRDKSSKTIEVEQQGEAEKSSRKYGYVRGLAPQDRVVYEKAIDEVRQHNSTDERIDALQKKIDELNQDPSKFVLKRYLESELGHILNSEDKLLSNYEVDQDKVS